MRSSALPDVLPITTTKVGPGDKQRAYVVRQNVCLKLVLGVIVTVCALGAVLASTKYEVHVQQRLSLVGARQHREEEHASHMRVMRLSMLLQQHLEDEIHDAKVLTTYRAWLLRAVGDYQAQVADQLRASNCSAVESPLLRLGIAFDAKLEGLLKHLWDDMVKEGRQAQRMVHNFSRAIVSELRADASEEREYERIMREHGEDPGALGYHNHEVGYHGHHEGDGHYGAHDPEMHGGHGMGHGYHSPQGGDEGHDDGSEEEGHPYGGYHSEDDDDDEEHLAGALESLYAHLQKNDSVVHVANATLAQWDQLHDSSLRALSDTAEEADLERINKRIVATVGASDVAPAFNETLWTSHVDFLDDLIHRARLAPYRAELLALLGDWQAGSTRISAPLKRIEELIDEDVLMPDVLIVHGDYEMYGHYNGDEGYRALDD